MKKWIKLSTDRLLDNEYIKVDKDHVLLGNGVEIDDFYKVSIKDAVIIVGLTHDNKVLLKREYRYCYEKELVELPAGCIEKGELLLDAAKRELLEETGFYSPKWTYLGETVESSSKLTNLMHVFLAENCERIGDQKLDSTEELEWFLVDFKRALEMVMNNEINCNSSSSALLKVARLIDNERL